MIHIKYKVNLVVYFIDNITGYSVTDNVTFSTDEAVKLNVIKKVNGIYAFIDMPEGKIKITACIFGYEDVTFQVDIEEREKPLEKTVCLIPNKYYLGQTTYKSISGVYDGIKAIEAVRLSREICRYKEFDERKRIITIYNHQGRDFKEVPYAIVHNETGSYETFNIIKHISEEQIKVEALPEKTYITGDKINRICVGRVFEGNKYEIKLADEGNEKYIIKYYDVLGEHFRLIDFKVSEEIEL